MAGMKHELAQLAVSLFSPNVDSADSVEIAARQIHRIYSAILELNYLSDELVAIDRSLYDDATERWNGFRRRQSFLDQKTRIQEPMDPGTTEGKLSWKEVQLLSHDIRYQVASLRFR